MSKVHQMVVKTLLSMGFNGYMDSEKGDFLQLLLEIVEGSNDIL
jgi:hypothetical protein